MSSTEYRVELDLFSGPLDLLLYLVRRNELDIVDLPIAPITNQFQQYLMVLEFIDLDLAGDFVVMASTLVEIKSRQVLPRAEEEETIETADDPRSDLIQQLLEYKKFKDAAKALEERAAEWQEHYPRLSDDRPNQGKDPSADLIKEVELWDLVSALARVVQRKVVDKETSIRYDDTPISNYVEEIGKLVRSEQQVAFTSLFDGASLRSKIIGMFLAILELLRHHAFRAEQSEEFGEIWIRPPFTPEELAALAAEQAAAETTSASSVPASPVSQPTPPALSSDDPLTGSTTEVADEHEPIDLTADTMSHIDEEMGVDDELESHDEPKRVDDVNKLDGSDDDTIIEPETED